MIGGQSWKKESFSFPKVTETSKQRKFISPDQTLEQALSCIQPCFKNLYDEIKNIYQILNIQMTELPQQLEQLCRQTFTLKNSGQKLSPEESIQAFSTFDELLQDSVSYLIKHSGRDQFIQCSMISFKGYALKHQTLNFSKTIIEKSFIRHLFDFLNQRVLYQILCNYVIVLKYQNDYVQVAGRPLNLDFNSLLNQKRKKNQGSSKSTIIDPYEVNIKRTLIFYCSHINRSSGIFHKNMFFDKGITISASKEEMKIVLNKFMAQFKVNLQINMKAEYFDRLGKLMEKLFIKMREVFSLKIHKGKKRCYFECLLKNFCPLPPNYKQLKQKTHAFINSNRQNCEQIFDELYSSASDYSQVTRLLKNLLDEIVPIELVGKQNLDAFKSFMKQFVSMKRYENLRMEDYLHSMNVFSIPWLELKFNRKFKNQIIRRGQKVLATILAFILNDIIIPVIKLQFYVTEQHKQANRIFYYRKPLWILISKLALFKFSQQNLNKLNSEQVQLKRMSTTHFPEGKLRILPKKGTFRPIITFNKKMKVDKGYAKQTLQKILANTQLVLRNMKNNLWNKLGFSVFDNRQIRKKFDSFIQKWRAEGCPKLAYFTLDIKKCYDSINTHKLLEIIENTPFIEKFYLIKKYQRLYRNKRPLIGNHNIGSFFNLKDRIAASSLSQDPFIVHQNDSIPSITVFSTRQRSINKEKVLQNLRNLCQGSIINYKKECWSQDYGIPQGLNVSGVLCSLYFGTLENKFVRKHVKKGLLMRLTDDYLYLGYQDQARQVLNSLIKCANQNKFKFSDSKMSKNFYHKDYPHIDQRDHIVWIGKKINIKTLQMEPYFEKNQKIQYAMNVNLKRANIKSFMKNKLKSLLTNHFESYFKPELFAAESNMQIIKIYVKVSLQKFFPFLKKFFILKLPNPQLQILQILESTFHDYIVYVCMLMKKCCNKTYLFVKKNVMEEIVNFFGKKKSESEFKFIHLSYVRKLNQLSDITAVQQLKQENKSENPREMEI